MTTPGNNICSNEDNHLAVFSPYSLPSALLNSLYLFAHLTLARIPGGQYSYYHLELSQALSVDTLISSKMAIQFQVA